MSARLPRISPIASTGLPCLPRCLTLNRRSYLPRVMTQLADLEKATTGQAYPADPSGGCHKLCAAHPTPAGAAGASRPCWTPSTAIERTAAVITATEQLRDSLLHELLTRGLPGWHTAWKEVPGLGPIPADWEVVRLGDICTSPQYGAGASARPYDSTLPRYVRITDITDDGRLREDGIASAEPLEVEGYNLQPGDLLFARSGATVGKTYLYRAEDGPCVYAGYLIRFQPLRESASPEFLERCTRSQFYQRWVESMFRAGAQPNINAAEYSSLSIPLPPLEEQEAIAASLDGVDSTLERVRQEREHLRALKASTADALLTGRVRVVH